MNKKQLKNELLKKQLIKPASVEDRLIREVTTLCAELRDCAKLRRLETDSTENEDDVLF